MKIDTDVVKAAIEAKDIVLEAKDVTVSAKALKAQGIPPETVKAAGLPTNKDGDIVVSVNIPVAQNAKGMAALCNGKIAPATAKPETGKDERTDEQKAVGACDYFNYGVDLEIRQASRQGIMAKLESPEKAIEKMVKALVDGGLYETEAAAREYVVESRKAKGLPV